MALLHSFLLHCQAAAAAVFALLLLSAHNLALLATPPPLSWSRHAAAQLTHSRVFNEGVFFDHSGIVYQCNSWLCNLNVSSVTASEEAK